MASATNKNPHRLFLVSVPRTASNLLVKILNIQHQPNVLTNEKSGYFLQDAYLTNVNKGYFNSPVSQRTDAEKAEIRDAYQQSLNKLEAFSEQAQRDNKIMFTKEHAFWFVNPATMLDAEPSASEPPVATNSDESRVQQDYFRLTFSDVYGPKQTFSPNNKTLFPDEYLRTWQFAFIIRHPALAWPSLYRAMQKMSKLGVLDDDGINGALVSNMSWRWTRNLFDWCSEQSEGSPVPLILDAHDVIHSQDVVLRFCEKAGLDKNVVQFEWEEHNNTGAWLQNTQNVVSDRNMEAMVKIMTSTLMASKGIIKDKTPGTVEIDVEVEKWKEEFGLEAAALIEKAARDSMPDYEYLRERSLKV